MANGNGHNGTANGKGWIGNTGLESFGLGIAEFVSAGVSLGVVAVADQIAPNMLDSCSKALSKVVVEPYVESIENSLKKICKLEECQPDYSKSRQERAEALSKTLIVFSAAWATSMIAKIGTRMGLNRVMGVTSKIGHVPIFKTRSKWINEHIIPATHDVKVMAFDEGVHLGSLVFVNTAAAKYTDDAIHVTSSLLQKWTGCSKRKADEIAAMGMIWEVPNFVGWLAGVGTIAHENYSQYKKSLIKKIIGGSGPDKSVS